MTKPPSDILIEFNKFRLRAPSTGTSLSIIACVALIVLVVIFGPSLVKYLTAETGDYPSRPIEPNQPPNIPSGRSSPPPVETPKVDIPETDLKPLWPEQPARSPPNAELPPPDLEAPAPPPPRPHHRSDPDDRPQKRFAKPAPTKPRLRDYDDIFNVPEVVVVQPRPRKKTMRREKKREKPVDPPRAPQSNFAEWFLGPKLYRSPSGLTRGTPFWGTDYDWWFGDTYGMPRAPDTAKDNVTPDEIIRRGLGGVR